MSYERQDRGDPRAYAAYFAGMDASMQQKIALTTAFFPTQGRIADMGSGSGRGTFDLASLYTGLDLVGVDINPVMVDHARATYQRPNLSYEVGDIAEAAFDPESLDGILNSSVLHHVSSFNGFSLDRVLAALDAHTAQLRAGGVLIIRDFVIPNGPAMVLLDLPDSDGAPHGAPPELSTAALFLRFARDFRSSVNPAAGVPYEHLGAPRPGWARFRVALRAATEFILRKDYRADWETELAEEYTYLSQRGFEDAFRARGLRVLSSLPIANPWIVQNRYVGRLALWDERGAPLDFPPTNYLIVGEKVAGGAGVALAERRAAPLAAPSFLRMRAFRDAEGRPFELAERPGTTVDLLPWFSRGDQRLIMAKKGFPRPIVNACADHPSPGGLALAGYMTEPISAIIAPEEPLPQAAARILAERAAIPADQIRAIAPCGAFYTTPGGLSEQVVAALIEVAPQPDGDLPVANYTPFTSAGVIRALDAGQVLRACQVGGIVDARLEIAIYRLLRRLAQPPGPWIGAAISPAAQAWRTPAARAADLLSPPPRARYTEGIGAGARYLALVAGAFEERDAQGRAIARADLEYLVPAGASRSTVVALPIIRLPDGRALIGVEDRDLPAPQHFSGSSAIAAAPAYRLPLHVQGRAELQRHAGAMLGAQFGLRVRQCWELGGAYLPSPGVTPEVVYPLAVEVEAASADRRLAFVGLDEVVAAIDSVRDMHLLIAAGRLAHALG